MKALSCLLLALALGPGAHANGSPETVNRVLSHIEEDMEIELNADTVRCLVGDYGARSLKISVPALRNLTLFRHTTRGEVQPCVNAGFCKGTADGTLSPEDVLDQDKPTETARFTVDLVEVLTIDHQGKQCFRSLQETVKTRVRGVEFKHFDQGAIDGVSYELCLEMKKHPVR